MLVTNSLTGGGAERSMNLVANELAKREWPISLVPINSSPPDQIVPLCSVFPLNRQWKGNLLNTLTAFWKFHHVVSSWKPDIIVLNCDLPEMFGATLLGKHELLVVEHSSTPWGQRILFGRIIRKTLIFRKAHFVAVASHLRIWPSRKIPLAVLQNPLTPIRNLPPQSSIEQIKRLVFIGRLSPEKRPDFALEISVQTGIELKIIGNGALRTDLEKKCLQDGINVSFSGQIEDPWSEIRTGDLLIVPSAFEGDGLVVIEGLQHQIPMLLADIPDLRRFRFSDNNYCVDVPSFSVQVKNHLWKLQDLRIPDEISVPIVKSRSIEAVGLSWEKFLTGLH